MPTFLVRKTEAHYLLIDAPTAWDAEDQAAAMPDSEWEQSDGPLREAELVTGEGGDA